MGRAERRKAQRRNRQQAAKAAAAGRPRSLQRPQRPIVAPPVATPTSPVALRLGNLKAAVRRRQELERSIGEQVAGARAAGATWRQIGAALGVSHVAALKRYGT